MSSVSQTTYMKNMYIVHQSSRFETPQEGRNREKEGGRGVNTYNKTQTQNPPYNN